MNIKRLTKDYHQFILPTNPLLCFLVLPMISLSGFIQPVLSSMKSTQSQTPPSATISNQPLELFEPKSLPLIDPVTKKKPPDPTATSTVNSKDPPPVSITPPSPSPLSSSSSKPSHIFKYHCSPWIEEKVWNKINSRSSMSCSTGTGCRGRKSTINNLPLTGIQSNTIDSPSRVHQSDTIILDDTKLPSSSSSTSPLDRTSKFNKNTNNNNNNNSNAMWPTHPLPRRMSDNLSPAVCGYTGSNTINDTLDWMQDYLHIMRSFNYAECLLFDNSTIDSICLSQSNQRIEKLKSFNFAHCDRYPLVNVLSDDAWAKLISSNNSLCVNVLEELNSLDSFAKKIYCQFQELLSRYKCETYSIKGTCSACKKAYKEWVCSMVLPFYFDGIYIKPCRSFCEKVEQKCPHLHPATTYAGEPVFICIDPKIPYFRNSSNIPYGSPDECYESCHLANETDLYTEKSDKTSCLSYESLLANVLKKSLKEEMDDWKGDVNGNNTQAVAYESNYTQITTQLNKVNPVNNNNNKKELNSTNNKMKDKEPNIVHVRRSSSSLTSSSSFDSTSLPSSSSSTTTTITSSALLDRRPRDRLTETTDSATTDPGTNLESGSHKTIGINTATDENELGGVVGPGDSHRIQSMALPLDDDGSDDESERDDESISTTSSASSTLPSTVSSTHFSVSQVSSLPNNSDMNLTLSKVYHFPLIFFLLGLVR